MRKLKGCKYADGGYTQSSVYMMQNPTLPILNALNIGMSTISEHLKLKEQDEYNRQMILLQSQDTPVRHPEGMDKYGNPAVYEGGGVIPEDISWQAPVFDMPVFDTGFSAPEPGNITTSQPGNAPSSVKFSQDNIEGFKRGINNVEWRGHAHDYAGSHNGGSSAFGPYGFLANQKAALGAVYNARYKGKMSFNDLVNKMKTDPQFHEEVMTYHSESVLNQAGGDPFAAALLHFYPVAAKKFKAGKLDLDSRPSANNLTFKQYLNNFAKGAGIDQRFAEGGDVDPNPKGPVYKTQAEVDAANDVAKRISKKHNTMGHEDVYVAKRPGDPVVPFLDETGRPFVPTKLPAKRLLTTLPPGIGINDIKSQGNTFWFENNNGDIVDVDPSVVTDPKFRKTQVENDKVLAMRNFLEGGEIMHLGGKAHVGSRGPISRKLAKRVLKEGKINDKKLTTKQKHYFKHVAGGKITFNKAGDMIKHP